MKFTKIPENTFKQLVMNAGIIVDEFTPATGEYGNLIGATTGGINFTATPTYADMGDDIDNCPKNTMELKKLTDYEISLSGTFLTVTADVARMLVGAADVDATDATHIVPRVDLDTSDFTDIWWVGDYSDKNGTTNGGYCAIHMKNVLNTAGFQIQTTDREKGQFAFEFGAHYSISAQDEVPFEIYVKAGTTEPTTSGTTGTTGTT